MQAWKVSALVMIIYTSDDGENRRAMNIIGRTTMVLQAFHMLRP